MLQIVTTVLVGLSLILLTCSQQPESYTVTYTNGVWKLSPGSGGIADATYTKSMNEIGWETLSITTDKNSADNLQAFAAGYIEGALTAESIWNAWLPYNQSENFNAPNLQQFVTLQDTWSRTQAKGLAATSDYWTQVGLVLAQFDGLVKGYADLAPAEQQLTYVQQLYIQLQDEVGDISTHLELKSGTYKENPNPTYSHCSSLVRVSPDGKQLFSSHDTWNTYNAMLRIFKYYNFNYNHPSNKAVTVTFSSYPATLQSIDDFYLTSQELYIAETTNSVFNASLYLDFVSTQTVPEWIRIIVANRLATSAPEWANYFGQYNSGTYNNQWQVVDYKLFTPGQPIQKNTLWVLEQIPGYVVADDQSSYLINQGFWPSYNVPFYPEIYNLSGYAEFYQKYGDAYSYTECARAKIFHRDAHNVQTIDDMKKIMRYNEYQTDPFSLWDACRQIAARCDLNTPWSNNTYNGYNAFGAIDSKITDNTLIQKLQAWAISGPTWDAQPPFAWTNAWENILHPGMPQIYDFDWEFMDLNPKSQKA